MAKLLLTSSSVSSPSLCSLEPFVFGERVSPPLSFRHKRFRCVGWAGLYTVFSGWWQKIFNDFTLRSLFYSIRFYHITACLLTKSSLSSSDASLFTVFKAFSSTNFFPLSPWCIRTSLMTSHHDHPDASPCTLINNYTSHLISYLFGIIMDRRAKLFHIIITLFPLFNCYISYIKLEDSFFK